MDIKKHV